MIAVREISPNVFEPAQGTITSLDGKRRAPLAVILHESWSNFERQAFGIHLVEPAPVPAGQRAVGSSFIREGDQIIEVLDLEPWVPVSVTPRQLQLALLAAGRLDDIDAFLAQPGTPREAKIAWEYATEYRRDDAMLNQMASLLTPPMPPEEIDQIFIEARQL